MFGGNPGADMSTIFLPRGFSERGKTSLVNSTLTERLRSANGAFQPYAPARILADTTQARRARFQPTATVEGVLFAMASASVSQGSEQNVQSCETVVEAMVHGPASTKLIFIGG